MKKNIFMFVLFTVSVFLPLSASAEETKLGYVDLQSALSSSNAGKSAREMFKGEVDRIQKDLDVKQNDLTRLKDELENQGLLLSAEAKVKKEKEYQDKLKAVQRYYQDAQEELGCTGRTAGQGCRAYQVDTDQYQENNRKYRTGKGLYHDTGEE
jgi:outer membrane protein